MMLGLRPSTWYMRVFYGNVQVVYLAHWTIHSAENALSLVIHSHYFVSRDK